MARDKQLEELKKANGDNATLQEQIKKLQEENKTEKQKYETELKNLRIMNAVKLAVSGKAHDEELVAGLIAKDKLVIDEGGKVIGLEEQVKSLQETKAFLFKGQETQNYKPQDGKKITNNPFAKETFNLTEQGKLLRENPIQAKEMAAAAGISI
ncbi:phage scaffolding protein [Lachnospiraceae bacterium 45-W7]